MLGIEIRRVGEGDGGIWREANRLCSFPQHDRIMYSVAHPPSQLQRSQPSPWETLHLSVRRLTVSSNQGCERQITTLSPSLHARPVLLVSVGLSSDVRPILSGLFEGYEHNVQLSDGVPSPCVSSLSRACSH